MVECHQIFANVLYVSIILRYFLCYAVFYFGSSRPVFDSCSYFAGCRIYMQNTRQAPKIQIIVINN